MAREFPTALRSGKGCKKEVRTLKNETNHIPQYTRIAVGIASRIASGEFPEGRRLFGKSTLSSKFNVSQETVRKAMRLLADMGIVEIRESSGTTVRSAEAARRYLETMRFRQEQTDLRDQLRTLFSNYNDLGKKILEISDSLIASVSTPLPSDQNLPLYKVTVPDSSDKVNMSIGELRFWQCTGATVVAIKRGQNVLLSPGPYADLRAGDVLIYVGPPDSQKAVQQLLTGGRTQNTLYRIQEQITSAVHMKELSVVADALNAKLGDITDFTAMTKGMTNRSYMFSCKGKRYILRIPGEGTANLIDRAQEAQVYRAIAGTGLCDDVVYLDPKNGLKVTAFLDGVRTCDPYNEEDLKRCMAMLRRFHGIRLQVDHTFDIFGNIEYYESLWNGVPSVHEHYSETKAQVMSLKDYIEAHRGEPCLCHNDAVPDNFLFYMQNGEERLQLTDWEYAGMQDPHVDVAMFIIYSLYDREHADHLIDLYFEGECDPATRIKIYCYIAACGLLWSNWTEYKRQLGVEFGDYSAHQYRYAWEYYEIVRKELEKS